MLLQMYHFFFGCFQKQPKSKCIFLRPPQILNFNSWIHITDTEGKKKKPISDACRLQSSSVCGVCEGQVRTPPGDSAPPVRGARTGHAAPPLRPCASPLCPESPAPLPAQRYSSQPDQAAQRRPQQWRWAAGQPATPRLQRARTQRRRARLRKVWTRKYIDRLHLSDNWNKGRWRKDAGVLLPNGNLLRDKSLP